MKIHIREATYNDLEVVFDLVKELALYEHEPESVTTTIGAYQKAFKEGSIYISIAEDEGKVVGIMLYYWAFSTWRGPMMYLEDFVVRESYRRHGVGQLLFDAFVKDSKRRGAVMVKWQVLDWNDPAINFYKKNNATIEKEWWNVKIIF